MNKNYNIGLDIGTNSVGWAVTDEDGKLLKRNGRHLWGVRLFEKANTASERRMFRSNARRLDRRKERIKLLQDLLKEDVCKEYPNFYNDLQLTKYQKGDGIKSKNITRTNKYNIFSEKEFSDLDYYKKYKTIYHLRQELCENSSKADIRLVYLALHHIIKYRGNFLYEGTFKPGKTVEMVDKLKELLDDFIVSVTYTEDVLEETFKILSNNNIYKKEKIEKIVYLYETDNDTKKKLKGIFSYIIGLKTKLSLVFAIEEDKSIRLTDDYDEDEIANLLGEDYYYFEILKELNSWYTLQDILKGTESVSEAFKNKYDKYNKDLKLLKDLYKSNRKKYNNMFKINEDKLKNYCSYDAKKTSLEDLYKTIKKDLEDVPDCISKQSILNDIENEEFLVRINSRENGAIPHQLHKNELEKIIDNQSKYYNSLKENKDKIISLLTFRIPYYVGPLNSKDNPSRNWSIRYEGKENEKVYPWNFEKIINLDASANEFIRRMTNKCTYLPEEDVIPKNSLLYSEYCLLNELNNVRYNGKKLSKEEKETAIEKLFKVNKTVTKTKFKKFLEEENHIEIKEITGLQKENEFASSLTSYIDFTKDILGEVNSQNYCMIEQIIEWITVFEDKSILKRKLESLEDENKNKILSEDQIKKILKKNYSGWSRLSKKLLVELKYINEYNQKKSVMDILRETDYNFMQIINDKTFGFDKQIEAASKKIEYTKISDKFYEENIATLAGSPAIKRGIWQTLKVVDELTKVLKAQPKNIFIEFAREDEDKKRTSSRKAKLKKAYDKFKEENYDQIDKELIRSLNDKKEKDITERLYLYYMQNGKCMYSGKALDIDNLELYQIDHIIPQSKIKDDSFDNKVLVFAKENQRKLDGFISNNIIDAQKENWRKLYEAGLISQVKYFNLLNNVETDKRVEGFIKRQLVETRQITKYVTNILKNVYENSEVYAIKATLGHDFREKFDILKIREMNDYHHAHDAYITSIIGNHIIARYPKMLKEFIYSDYIKEFNRQTSNNNTKNKYGFIVSSIEKGYVDSNTGEIIDDNMAQNKLKNIIETFSIKDVYITKKLEEKTGAFYNQNPLSKDKVKENSPRLKEGLDPLKYGAYSGEIGAYYVLISYIKKNKKEYLIESVPVKESLSIKSKEDLFNYLNEKLKLDNMKILKPKLLTNQLLYKNGKPYYFVSHSEIKSAKQLRLGKDEQILLYVALSNGNIKFKLYQEAERIIKHKECIENLNKEEIQNIKENCLNQVYDILTNKIKQEYFENVGLKLELCKENYLTLDDEDKAKTIKLLLDLTCGRYIDLKIVGGKSSQGRICNQNMNTKWLEDVKFIDQSITGIYEKRYTKDELENCNSI